MLGSFVSKSVKRCKMGGLILLCPKYVLGFQALNWKFTLLSVGNTIIFNGKFILFMTMDLATV